MSVLEYKYLYRFIYGMRTFSTSTLQWIYTEQVYKVIDIVFVHYS